MTAMRRWAIGLAAIGLTVVAPASAQGADELKVVGRLDLGGKGGHAGVAAWESAAIVVTEATAGTCGAATVTVVDVKKPSRPRVLSSAPLPFAGPVTAVASDEDRAAVASAGCGGQAGGVAYYRAGRLLGRAGPIDARSVALGVQADHTLAAIVSGAPAQVDVQDWTDPAKPVFVASWSPPRGRPVDAAFRDLGRQLFVLTDDGLVYDVDLSAGTPAAAPALPTPGGAASAVAALTLADRTVGIVSAPDGLHVLDGRPAAEARFVRSTTGAAPGKALTIGDYAYTPWHGEGLRVIDLGGVHAMTAGVFAPAGCDIVGVALLPQQILALDRNAGVYVLGRPSEGAGAPAWWENGKAFFALLAAALLAILFAVPRVARMLATAGQAAQAPVPVAQRVRRGARGTPRRRR